MINSNNSRISLKMKIKALTIMLNSLGVLPLASVEDKFLRCIW